MQPSEQREAMGRSRLLRTTGLIVLTVGAIAAVGALIVRDQIARHRRDLFSSRALRRFAALGYISRRAASNAPSRFRRRASPRRAGRNCGSRVIASR